MDILPALMALSIPIIALLGNFYLKSLKIKHENSLSKTEELKNIEDSLKVIQFENDELKKRIQNLEVCIVDNTDEVEAINLEQIEIIKEKK